MVGRLNRISKLRHSYTEFSRVKSIKEFKVAALVSEDFVNSFQTYNITDTVQKIAESFECKPIEGMLSHALEQNVIDGEKTIIQNPNEAQRKEHEKYDFELHEVYAIDVLVSTGEGQGRE